MTTSPAIQLAPAPLCRAFEADVLERLRTQRAALHGCAAETVECRLDGAVVIWFAGPRDGAFWRGALRFSLPWLHQRRILADAGAVAEVALQLLAAVSLRPSAAILQRADA